VAMERSRRSETRTSSSPRKMFRGRLRVGERTMDMGFMAFALPLNGALGPAASEPKERAKSPRATFIICGSEWDLGAKEGGGTTVWTPCEGLGIRD